METRTVDGVEVTTLAGGCLDEAVGVLTRAFRDNPNFVHLFPNAGIRDRALPLLHRAGLLAALGGGEVHVALISGRIVGVAVWVAPVKSLLPALPLRAVPDSLRMMAAAPRSVGRLLKFASTLAKLRPGEPHWYLQEVAVDPAAQGCGIGTKLLEPVLARADREARPCYLETMTEKNVAWYRRLGFETLEEGVSVGRGGPSNWTMLRRSGQDDKESSRYAR